MTWLGARHAPLVVVLVGLALASPALTAGFAADDHLHRVISRDDPGIDGLRSRPLDLFVFASGDPDDNARLRDAGLFPWWTDLRLRLAFFRPVSSATHAVDHALWPESATAQLAHNLAWLAVALIATWGFYRRFVPVRWIAVLGLLLYAVDDARGPVVGWIANRNALIALALAVPVLLAHDRWRSDGWAPGRWVGPGLFVIALGAGESALAITAYLGAHALWLDRGPWKDRAIALAPYALIVIGWRLLYGHLGYGVEGSGIYLDPGGDPAGFAAAAAVRLPLLLLGQLGLPWSDLASMYPVMGAGVVVTIVAIGLALVHLVFAPPFLLLRARSMVTVGGILDRADAGIPSGPEIADKTVVIAAAPSDALAGYVPIMRASRRQPRPAHLYWLATASAAVTLERVDDRTLRVIPAGGFLRHEIDRMVRTPRARPFAPGDRVELTGLTLEVETVTSDRRPARVLARFDRPLEDPSLIWLRWEGNTYVPYRPPPVGAAETLPAVDFLRLLEE